MKVCWLKADGSAGLVDGIVVSAESHEERIILSQMYEELLISGGTRLGLRVGEGEAVVCNGGPR